MSVQTGTKRKEGGFAETVRVVFHALIIALVIRTFLFQPFNIPSGSMIPTLLVGDYLFVSKFSYGYTHYSFPFSPPIFSGRIFSSQPQRGDVVVFRLPKDDSVDYIKRVVGLPGDRIQMIDGVLNINGVPVPRQRVQDMVTDEDGVVQRVKQYRETLPNGVSYNTLDLTDNGFYDNTPVYTVPPGDYFMMGDNRDNSTDSRVLSQVGYIPGENIIGRAQIIFFSIRDDTHAWEVWRWPWSVQMGPLIHNCAMSSRRKRKPAEISKRAADQSPAHFFSAPAGQSDGSKPSRASKALRRRKRAATALEDRIGYHFTDPLKLEIALTHISALKGARNRAGSYQRLEFLGDHVLGLVISDMLYRTFPKADEGELSRRLADLVRKETCTEIALSTDLGAAIRVGSSEQNAGARSRPAILADVCEAVIG